MTDPARLTDEELLARVRAAGRDRERALELLVARHVGRVRARLRLRVPDHLVDDMTHDVLVDAIDAALAGRRIESFRAWLDRVVANTRAEYYRGKEYRRLVRDREAAALGEPRERGAEADFGEVELRELIEQLLARRSPAHRAVIERYVLGDLSANETARASGESAGNVYKIAQRFRDDLRAALAGGEAPRTGGDTGGAL
jgi:RNA polymerase sigma factor (sigma-70 family)